MKQSYCCKATAQLHFVVSAGGIKEEIKAAYGYESIYSVQAVGNIAALHGSTNKKEREQSGKREEALCFGDVLKKTLAKDNHEVRCTMHGYGKSGAYQDYLYLKREYYQ